MGYTYDEIVRASQDIHVGRAPTAPLREIYRIVASLNAGAQVRDDRGLGNLVNSADDGTALAMRSYQFFIGKSPTQAGTAYLVNASVNPTDLSNSHYARLNLENSSVNFAAVLGVDGKGAFAAKYGAMDFSAYVASICQAIVGARFADAAEIDVAAAVAYLVGTKGMLLAMVRDAGMVGDVSTPGEVDIALKAAMAGLVMAASIEDDVGLHAATANNFMVALAANTAAYGAGEAVDRAPPEPSASPAPSSDTFALSEGANRFTGGPLGDVLNVLLGELRRRGETPVVMVTALGQDLVKPFNPIEVTARVQAILRRRGGALDARLLRVGPVEVNTENYLAAVVQPEGRRRLDLTLTEFRILAHMARIPLRVFTRAELTEACFPNQDVAGRTVDSHVSHLRRKLDASGAPGLLVNVRGVGYRLEPVE